MVNVMVTSVKVLLAILYGVSFLSLFSLPPIVVDYRVYLLAILCLVLLAHLIEFLVMKTKVENISNKKMSFSKTMLWGCGYWLPIIGHNASNNK